MAWFALLFAGLSEILGVLALKSVTKYRNLLSYLFFIFAYACSFSLLTFAMTEISMGTAYAIWTGIGGVGSALLGMFAFGEAKDWRRLIFIFLILASAVGLKLIS